MLFVLLLFRFRISLTEPDPGFPLSTPEWENMRKYPPLMVAVLSGG